MANNDTEELEQYFEGESDEWEDASQVGYPEAIGNFLIQFSSFDGTINQWVANGINDRSHQPGYHVLQLLSISNKIDLLERMTLLSITNIRLEMRDEFKDLILRIRKVNTFRNKIAHANWISLRSNGEVHTKILIDKDEGTVKFEKTKITPQMINETIDEMGILTEAIYDFFERFEEACRA